MASIGPPALGAKGCVERLHPIGETTHYDLCVAGAPSNHVRCASLRSGGHRLAVRIAIEYHIAAQPRTPFPASRDFAPVGSMSLDFQVASLSYKSSSFATSRGNERYEGKTERHILHVPLRCFPPLVAGATTFPPQARALWMLSHGAMSLQESIERFILSPGWGKVRRSRIRGSRVAANHQNGYFAI